MIGLLAAGFMGGRIGFFGTFFSTKIVKNKSLLFVGHLTEIYY